MGYQYVVTRGAGFLEPFEPIAPEAWDAAVARLAPGGRVGPGLRDVVTFEAGRGFIASPSLQGLRTVYALAAALAARVFGEDEPPLTVEALDQRLHPEPAFLAAWNGAQLEQPTKQALLELVDPLTAESERETALSQLTELATSGSGAQRRAVAAWLLCWSNDESRLGPVLLEALLAFAREHVDLAENVAPAAVVSALRGEPLFVCCTSCSSENRLPRFPPRGKRARCGACKTELELWGHAGR